ncbi:MAG: 16S rRNA methyltransferase [Candidatus Liptonbacteria bacterium]|nr:16S rRNA methyltransferase [Candidatus Liptonbacteria bacterium]
MEELEHVVVAVQKSPTHRHIARALIARLAAIESAKRGSPPDGREKEIIKAVKNKLHQTVGAFVEGRPDYKKALRALAAAAREEDAVAREERIRAVLQQAMQFHASTRERLPFLESFYRDALRDISPPGRVLDLACGLNPLARPWLGIPDEAEYLACDVRADLTEFVNGVFAACGWKGRAFVRDLLSDEPLPKADAVLLLKTIPCLEQVEKDAGARLLARLDAPHAVVSFPGKSLGGREKGMRENYAAHFLGMLEGTGWKQRNFVIGEELVFVLSR